MKVLIIGGTGTISAAVTREAAACGWEVTVLNRGNAAQSLPAGVKQLRADIQDQAAVQTALGDRKFDAAVSFLTYTPANAQRDWELLRDRVGQYVFISSASAYHKPLPDYLISEGTPIHNPHSQYSRDKIACEEIFMQHYREDGFPVTIVRPSHTYCETRVPLGLHGKNGSWQVLRRMLDGKRIVIHGDGSSLWTMTHSSDFARAFVGLLGNPRAIGGAVHITSDESMTWNQIYGTVADALGVPLRAAYVPSALLAQSGQYDFAGSLLGDKAHTVVFDNAKIKRLVPGWYAKVSMREGLRAAAAYVLAHPECQVADPAFDAWCDKMVSVMDAAAQQFRDIGL